MAIRSPASWPRFILNGLIATVTISYPFLVWFSLDYLQPRDLALILAALFFARLLLNSAVKKGPLSVIIPVCVLFLLAIAWANQTDWLLAYPVFVSLLFFTLFSVSLIYPPSAVERLARLEDPDLPPKGVAYTRKVTIAWSVFFLGNATISLVTVLYGDTRIWSLYNGCVFYILMGLLMAVEMAIRRKVKASY